MKEYLTKEQTDKLFNTITANGCREMEEDRFYQAVNEAIHISSQLEPPVEQKIVGGLLPCPFCGEVPSIEYLPRPLHDQPMIGVLRCCNTHITVKGKRKKSIAERIKEHWNKRKSNKG
jgi:hypothetical protein